MNNTNVISYLQSLSPSILQRIYSQQSSCLSIFRMLPQLAQAYVMRLLLIGADHPVPHSVIKSWAEARDLKGKSLLAKHQLAISTLRKLFILTPTNSASNDFQINEMFQTQLFDCLSCVSSVTSFGKRYTKEDNRGKSGEELEQYAVNKWESILHFIVGSDSSAAISKSTINVLERSGLMSTTDGELSITNDGFQFLLQDVNTQIWSFLLQLADSHESFGMDIADILNFFFFLSSLETGTKYSTEHLSQHQLTLLHLVRDIGIVYLNSTSSSSKSSKWFQPTRFCAILGSTNTSNSSNSNTFTANTTSTATSNSINSNKSGSSGNSFIIIETNYRVYAYTNSPLQIMILSLFTHLRARFPGFCVGLVTRDSVRRALSLGISAKQIVHFLRTHAHPQMRSNSTAGAGSSSSGSIVPATVVDQIALWELEKNRLDVRDGYLYKDFVSEDEYRLAAAHAKELGVLIWESQSADKLMMFINADGHEAVRAYVKSLIANRGQR